MDVDVVDTSDIDELGVLDVSEADHFVFYSPQSAFHHDASNLHLRRSPSGLHSLGLTPHPSPESE